MIAQIFLSLGLTVCLLYVTSLGPTQRAVRLGLLFVTLVGYVFIWNPEITNDIASLVGIGRGADLILYVWLVITLFIALRLHLLLRLQGQQVTELARALTMVSMRAEDER